MNKITSWFSTRLAMALVMVLSMSYAVAKNVLTIDPVNITSNAGVTVPVNLESDDVLRTLIFDITLPNGVTVKGNPVVNASRLDLQDGEKPSDNFTIDINRNPEGLGNNVWRVGVFGLYAYSQIKAGKGEIVSLNLAITEEAFFAGGSFTETISTEKTPSVEGSEFTVNIIPPTQAIAEVTVPAELNVSTGVKAKVEVSLNNNLPVAALMFDVELPEALTLAKNGRRYDLTYGPRWSESTSVQVTENEKGLRFIISNMSTNVIAAAGEGELLSFYVIAADQPFKTKFEVTGINATMKWGGKNIDVYSPNQTVSVLNTAAMEAIVEQMDEDEALLNELVTSYADFLAETEKNFPAFLAANQEESAAVYAQIEALNNSFESAKMDAEDNGVYAGLSAEEYSNATNALLALVTKEAEELAKIENAAMEDLEALQAFADKVTPIVDGDVVYNDEIETMAQNFLGELTKYFEEVGKAEATAKNETGEYVSPLTEEVRENLAKQYDAIEAQINEVVMGLIEEDQAIINELATTFAQFSEEADKDFPAFLEVNAEAVAAVNAQIEALNDEFIKAQEAAEETGVYEGVSAESISNATNALMTLIVKEAEDMTKIENDMVADQEALAVYAEKIDPIIEGEVTYNEEIENAAVELMAQLTKLSNEAYEAQANALKETAEYVSPLTEEVRANVEAQYNALQEAIVEFVMGQIEEDQAIINELATTYAQFIEEADKNFPAFLTANEEEVAAVYALIEAVNDEFVKAQEEAEESLVYVGVSAEAISNATNALMALVVKEAEEMTKIENDMVADQEALAVYAEKIDPIIEGEVSYNEVIENAAVELMAELTKYSNEAYEAQAKALKETGEYVSPLTEEVRQSIEDQYNSLQESIVEFVMGQIEEDQAIINELSTTYAQFVEETDKEFPAFLTANEEAVAAVYAQIEALNDEFVKAQEEAEESLVYVGVSAEAISNATNALMALIVKEAEDMTKIENDMVADQEVLAQYAEKIDAIIEGEVSYSEDIDLMAVELMAELTKCSNEVYEAQAKALKETGVYVSPLTEEVMASIEKAASDLENHIVEFIMGQMEEDQTIINDLANTYVAFNDEVAAEFPAFLELNAGALADVYAQIEALNELFVKAQEEAAETGVYTGVSAEAISNATNAMMELIAKEAQELAQIENATYEDMEVLSAYAEKLNPVLDDEDLSEDIYFFAGDIMGELYNYSNEVYAAEYVAKQETGVYVSPLNDEILADLDKKMAELEEMLKTSGIASMVNDAQGTIYYDLNGFEVKEPVAGKLYIKVENGKATKVIKK